MDYAFHIYNKYAADGAAMAIDKLLKDDLSAKLTPRALSSANSVSKASAYFRRNFDGNFRKQPVVVCIGSDLAVGDSLGPLTGSLLRYKTQGLGVFVYGTLSAPVTAKEVKYLRGFLNETHPLEQVLAVDAAVGAEGDIGLLKLNSSPLYPGAGANKKLGAIGDISVMGIVAEKSVANYGLLNTTRLNLVYTMAELLSDALATVLWERR